MVRIAADYSRLDGRERSAETVCQRRAWRDPDRRVARFLLKLDNQTEATVPGSHFIQEDFGRAIGRAVAGWIGTNAL